MSRQGLEQSANKTERDDGIASFLTALRQLEEKRELSHADRDAIQKAFDLLERGKQVSVETARTAAFALGIRLVQALDRIGLFGERGKPLPVETNFNIAVWNGLSAFPIDKGATLLITILSELRGQVDEQRKAKLTELIHEIEKRRKSNITMPVAEYMSAMKSKLIIPALAALLLFQEPRVDKSATEEKSG